MQTKGERMDGIVFTNPDLRYAGRIDDPQGSHSAATIRPHYMHGAAQRVDNREQELDFFTKAMVGSGTRADHGHSRENQAHGGKGRIRVYITDVVNTTSVSKDQQSQETRRRGHNVSPSITVFHAAGRGYLKFLGQDHGPTVVACVGKFIEIGAGAAIEKDGRVE